MRKKMFLVLSVIIIVFVFLVFNFKSQKKSIYDILEKNGYVLNFVYNIGDVYLPGQKTEYKISEYIYDRKVKAIVYEIGDFNKVKGDVKDTYDYYHEYDLNVLYGEMDNYVFYKYKSFINDDIFEYNYCLGINGYKIELFGIGCEEDIEKIMNVLINYYKY